MATTAQDAVNYDNGRKNNWRKQCWNLIVNHLKRAGIQPKDALVLYLPGTTNLDEGVALQKGFRRENLIAVERDKKVAHFIRKKLKVNCIQGDLIDVLMSWPLDSPKVDVVVADFQCGMLPVVEDTLRAYLCSPQITHSVLCVNALRGRDAGPFLDFAKKYDVNIRAKTASGNDKIFFVDERLLTVKDDPTKHRGVLIGRGFVGMLHANHFLQDNFAAIFEKEEELRARMRQIAQEVYDKTGNLALARKAYDLEDKKTDKEIDEWKEARLPWVTAVPGYKSGTQYMDAVVIQTMDGYCQKIWDTAREVRRLNDAGKLDDLYDQLRKAFPDHADTSASTNKKRRTATRRKIAAALAHRTMRSR
jgi:hypothetical protein